jgi:plasmid stabilization system protein ParE
MPPKYTVRLLPAAEADFLEIIAYIALDNPTAAGALADSIEKTMTGLQNLPFRGKIPDEENLRRMGYRYLVVGNYLILYTVEAQTVWIHRIIHGVRDYLSLF